MKLNKKTTKRTVETYAICACAYASTCTCSSCSCGNLSSYQHASTYATNVTPSASIAGNAVNGTV